MPDALVCFISHLHLIWQLDAGVCCKLTLITAPLDLYHTVFPWRYPPIEVEQKGDQENNKLNLESNARMGKRTTKATHMDAYAINQYLSNLREPVVRSAIQALQLPPGTRGLDVESAVIHCYWQRL